MQIRPDNDILAQYGSPSRPISPTNVSTPHKQMATSGNEPTKVENQTTDSQAGREPHLQQQHPAKLPLQFPPEIIDYIVDHLHDDKRSLIQCSRTSSVFSPATSYHLFRSVRIITMRECVEFQELVRSPLLPPSPISTPHLSPSSTLATSPAPRATHDQFTQSHIRSAHPHSDGTNAHPHPRHTCAPNCAHDGSVTVWDITKFVRKVEFVNLDSPLTTDQYVSEVVKLVRMLPRIREVTFGWWADTTGMEQIGQAFAAIPANPGHTSQPSCSVSMGAFPETQREHTATSEPLKVHLDRADFESVHAFLDFLESFGGRLRELGLSNVDFGGRGQGDFRGRLLPGIECVCLDHAGG